MIRRCTIFHVRVGLVRIAQKSTRTRYAEYVFLHPVGSVVTYCISVHPGREMSTHYFSSSVGTGTDLTKARWNPLR
jgi:hypothetical protein